ncbi:unnamed protein product, partial [Meganyctiphanes norvegica]
IIFSYSVVQHLQHQIMRSPLVLLLVACALAEPNSFPEPEPEPEPNSFPEPKSNSFPEPEPNPFPEPEPNSFPEPDPHRKSGYYRPPYGFPEPEPYGIPEFGPYGIPEPEPYGFPEPESYGFLKSEPEPYGPYGMRPPYGFPDPKPYGFPEPDPYRTSPFARICRRYCRNHRDVPYCCEYDNEPDNEPMIKDGKCPLYRDECPNTKRMGPPTRCSHDGGCSMHLKCCYDTCLEHHACKSPEFGFVIG